ncbi:MAG: hypothetical protein ACK5ZQ_14015 [bacterium]
MDENQVDRQKATMPQPLARALGYDVRETTPMLCSSSCLPAKRLANGIGLVNKLKNWLQNANGWKRLWFLLSAFGLFYMAVINPFVLIKDSNLSRYEYKWAVEKELKNPECLPFSTKPFAELSEPEYQDKDGNKGCYHIYNYRKYYNQTKVPYTSADLDSDFTSAHWDQILALSGFFSMVAIVLSALVYFLGAVVAWVVRGFRKGAN